MAGKLLKETEDMQFNKIKKVNKSNKKSIDNDEKDIYKIDFEQDDLDLKGEESINIEVVEADKDKPKKTRTSKAAKAKTKTSKKSKDLSNKNIIKVVEDEEEIDEIFGNVNKWLTDDELEESVKAQKTKKKRLTKIEEGIKSSKKNAKNTKKESKEIEKTAGVFYDKEKQDLQIATKFDAKETEDTGEIKIQAENDITDIQLRNNRYKIELQKLEYNIYTENSETSYIIVRDSGLRIVSGEAYIFLQKQGEDYEITTNQDFKINYVIDNITRKDNTVNFKLTNLTEIVASEQGLTFEIDEEKVIENNLEDNHTLVISEEDGKVYLPYTKEDIKNDVAQNKGTKISDVIEEKYVLPLDKYKNSIRARFREGYNLMYRKEGRSKKSAILLGIELMFETNLHPAIISACKNLEELDIYLDCLEDNELEKFSCFKIIYKSLPTLRKKAKFQEF